FPPEGCTSKNRPRESPNLYGFKRGFALRTAVAVRAICGGHFSAHSMWPPKVAPKFAGCGWKHWGHFGEPQAKYRSFLGVCKDKRGCSETLRWWAVTGSNRRPSRCKRDALPTELTARLASAAPLANPFARRQPSHELRGVFPDFLEIARDRAGCAPSGWSTSGTLGRFRPACVRAVRPSAGGMDFRRRPSSKPYHRRKSGARRGI